MSKKWIIGISGIVVVILIASIVLACVFGINYANRKKFDAGLSDYARQVLLSNFDKVELGDKAPLKLVINSENPLNLVNHYGDEEVTVLWNSIPARQKPHTVILLVGSPALSVKYGSAIQYFENTATQCEDNKIPFAIQNINGEYHMEERMPIAYMEKKFAKLKYLRGLNAAELYNGVDWRGENESDNSLYIMDCIKLSAKYGAYFFWTDTNRNYASGMLLEWLENNESFYSTFKEYSEYICLLNKESYGVPSTYAVMQGLWLAGLVGNWGVASDWWHWQVDGDKKSLFGEFDSDVDNEWDMILSYPESMYVQSMIFVMSRGATCFKAEAPNFSTSVGGKPIAGFEYGISPLLDSIIDGTIIIPDKATVFNETKIAVLGGHNWADINYNYEESNLYPASGSAGIIPLLPVNLRLAERNQFLSRGIPFIEQKLDTVDTTQCWDKDDNSNTYITPCGTSWYYVHNVENHRGNKHATFVPRISSANSVQLNTAEHTSAIVTESNSQLSFYINNYRTDKSGMIKQLTKEERAKFAKWADVNKDYLTLDDNGNPIGVDDTQLRLVEITIKGSYNGGKPLVELLSNTDGSGQYGRKFTFAEHWNPATQELIITLMMNGTVKLNVQLDNSDKQLTYPERTAIAETIVANDNDTTTLAHAIENKVVDKHQYTYFSYLQYDKAIAMAERIVTEKTTTVDAIKAALDGVNIASQNIIKIDKEIQLLTTVLPKVMDGDSKFTAKYDRLMRELLSCNSYRDGRTQMLQYSKTQKSTTIQKALKDKVARIAKHSSALAKLLDI